MPDAYAYSVQLHIHIDMCNSMSLQIAIYISSIAIVMSTINFQGTIIFACDYNNYRTTETRHQIL